MYVYLYIFKHHHVSTGHEDHFMLWIVLVSFKQLFFQLLRGSVLIPPWFPKPVRLGQDCLAAAAPKIGKTWGEETGYAATYGEKIQLSNIGLQTEDFWANP